MKKAGALHVAFNPFDPIILVGDERGGVNLLKLSASLSEGPEPPVVEEDKKPKREEEEEEEKEKPPEDPAQYQEWSMEQFLSTQDKVDY